MTDPAPVSIRVEFPAGPIQVQAAAPELSDWEADVLFALPTAAQLSDRGRQARAAATDAEIEHAIFGDVEARTPAEARALFGGE